MTVTIKMTERLHSFRCWLARLRSDSEPPVPGIVYLYLYICMIVYFYCIFVHLIFVYLYICIFLYFYICISVLSYIHILGHLYLCTVFFCMFSYLNSCKSRADSQF